MKYAPNQLRESACLQVTVAGRDVKHISASLFIG